MAKALFLIKLRKKFLQCILQIHFITKLTDKLKPNCLLKTLVLGSFANKLVILIIVAIELVLNFGYDTISKGKNYNLRSEYFEKSNN